MAQIAPAFEVPARALVRCAVIEPTAFGVENQVQSAVRNFFI